MNNGQLRITSYELIGIVLSIATTFKSSVGRLTHVFWALAQI